MKKLHRTKNFSYGDSTVKALHKSLNDTISAGVSEGITQEMPAAMTRKLKNDVFVFSGMKTYAELKEASGLLLNTDGTVKPFAQFSDDVQKINNTYNQSYLQAEYNFAVASSQQAGNWANIDMDKELQYRTAEDDRVRPEHAALDKITLPARDNFWNNYYPPNGWNCRCVAIEVNAGKYPQSNPSEAEKLGQAATTQLDKNGNNAAAIFRFNPGKQEVIFPPSHPYYGQHCTGAKLNITGLLGKAKIVLANEEEKCQWQNELKKQLPLHPSDPDFAKRYDNVEFKKEDDIQNGGVLEVPTNATQNKHEFEKNKNTLTVLANKGLKYRMMPVINDGSSNPDALNLANNQWADVKNAQSKIFGNIISNSFKEATKQGASEVIINLPQMPTSKEAYRELKGSLNPKVNKHIKNIVFVYGNDYKQYDVDKLRARMYNKKSSD